MSRQIRAALLFDQRIIHEKYFHEATLNVGPTGDFCVDVLTKNVALLQNGVLTVPEGYTASCSKQGQIEIARTYERAESFEFGEDDWLILNLGRKLDLVLCWDVPMAPLVGSPAAGLAERLSTPLSAAIVVSFLLHSFFIFSAFWFGKTQEEPFSIAQVSPRWIEMMASIDEHQEKEEEEEPEMIVEDVDDVLSDVSTSDILKPKVDDSPIAGLDKVDKPVGLQAALGATGLNNMDSLFGSTAGLGDAWAEMAESEDGTAVGVGAGFGMGLAGVGFGGGGGGGGGYGGGIGGLGGGGGAGKGGKVTGPKKSTVKPKPKLDLEAAKEGQFCKESNIRDVVQKRAAALRNCYEQQLLADPSLSGKVIVFWKIGLDGQVTEASIKSSTLKNDRVESCLTKTVRRLRFDKPDGGICVVEFPFIFTSN